MTRLKNLLCLILLFAGTSFSLKGFSQMKEMNDSVSLHDYVVLRGDTLLISCDSAHLLNNKTFSLYRDNYNRVRNNSLSAQKIFVQYDSLVALQGRMLKNKEADYQFLKRNFDSLVMASNTFVNRTDVNVTAINQSLTRAEGNINNIKSDLKDAMDKVKAEGKQRFKIAVKGFVVGVGVASLVFLLAK